MTITAAADGSALGNPGPAGWAWYVNDDCWRAGGWPHGTNNQGELMAVLDLFRATAHVPGEDLLILCDSQYVINAVTKWMPGWKRKGWRKADGKPVLNVDLLKDIDQALVGRKYTFEWVRGHAGHELNEAADVRARAAATAYQQGVAVRQGPGFGSPEGQPPEGETQPGRTQPGRTQPGRTQQGGTQQGGTQQGGTQPAGQAGSAMPQTAPETAPRTAPEQAARPAATRAQPAPAPSGQQELFGAPGAYDEPDLFSELEEEPAVALAEASPEAVVESLERELLRPETRADLGRAGVLLHPDFTEIGSSGRLWTRDAMMMSLEDNPGGPVELELLGADRLGEKTMLLTYRSHTRDGSALRSSLWVLEGAQWRLRFHQGTPEA
ncbi:RNase H family protein [Arthrobacter sp. NPDC056886]|uniref:RNase H family protein n=1 Tax=Arthrobacter sp. NPDC056886 TaxID=3345960 RepID=UPI00366BFEE8